MRFLFRALPLLGAGLALISSSAAGQNLSGQPTRAGAANLRLLTRSCGYIFDGTVLSVKAVMHDETGGVPTMEITFRIEQGIRGTRSGQVLAIREWAGLWSSGERYRPGERLLLFLYSPSKLGLTSLVGGQSGRFSVDSGGNVILENVRLPALAPGSALESQFRNKKRVNARVLAMALQRSDAE